MSMVSDDVMWRVATNPSLTSLTVGVTMQQIILNFIFIDYFDCVIFI